MGRLPATEAAHAATRSKKHQQQQQQNTHTHTHAHKSTTAQKRAPQRHVRARAGAHVHARTSTAPQFPRQGNARLHLSLPVAQRTMSSSSIIAPEIASMLPEMQREHRICRSCARECSSGRCHERTPGATSMPPQNQSQTPCSASDCSLGGERRENTICMVPSFLSKFIWSLPKDVLSPFTARMRSPTFTSFSG